MDCENDTLVPEKTAQIEQLLEEHRAWLHRLVTSRLQDAAAVDDVLQEVYQAVLASDNVPQQSDGAAFWLCRIALRQCAAETRRVIRRRQMNVRLQNESRQHQQATVDPIYWVLGKEERDQVQNALKQLDEPSQQLLEWKYIERLTYESIANRLSISRHAAEYRVLTARRMLRTILVFNGVNGEEEK